jgi:DNA-binding CsgD family transcriptional regulator
VQRHYDGLLWIPPPKALPDRDDEIHRMRAAGVPVPEIAERVGLSERRVWQILKPVD